MPKRRHTDTWITSVRRWEAGLVGPEGEQLALPGMPEPPKYVTTRVLPFVLVTYANHDGTSVRPSRESIARILGCSPRTVQRRIGELERLGLISRTNRAHRGHAQEWVLVLPAWLSGSYRKGDTGDSLSEPNGRHPVPQRETPVTPHHLSSREMTSSAVDGGAFTPPADTDAEAAYDPWANDPPAVESDFPSEPTNGLELTDDQKQRNRERIQQLRESMGWTRTDRVADGSRITDETKAAAIAALRHAHPEVSAPTSKTGTHERPE